MRASVALWSKRLVWGVLALVVYLVSIPLTLTGLYMVKSYLNINTLERGGWHHFNACLRQELHMEQEDMLKQRYGALASAAPVLVGLGVLPQPVSATSRAHVD